MLTPVENELPQQQVNAYFQSSSDYWKRIYDKRDLLPRIYQARHAAVLEWIAALRLPTTSKVLEIGCGAGVLTSDLAGIGYSVEAVDAVPAMVDLTLQKAIENGFADRVHASIADVHALPFPGEKFDVVIAVGVIPWLHDEDLALLEMQRVLKTGGYLIVTADNRWRLNHLLDPLSTPVARPFRSIAKFILRRLDLRHEPREFQPRRHAPAEVNRLLHVCGFSKMDSKCVGFGPFTFFRRSVLPASVGTALHLRLQCLADRRIPPFDLTGLHYLALARKGSQIKSSRGCADYGD
jgi:ubiquinone/menaquinone biosynthesis C-methylase UbiE